MTIKTQKTSGFLNKSKNQIPSKKHFLSWRTLALFATFPLGLSLTLSSITHAYTQEEYYRQQQYKQYQQQQDQQQRLEQERAMQEVRNIFNNGMAAFQNYGK